MREFDGRDWWISGDANLSEEMKRKLKDWHRSREEEERVKPLYEQERYDPSVDVIPRKFFKPEWASDEIEPVIFVLKHPVELKSSERSYYLKEGTVISIMGGAEKKGGESR